MDERSIAKIIAAAMNLRAALISAGWVPAAQITMPYTHQMSQPTSIQNLMSYGGPLMDELWILPDKMINTTTV